MVKLQPAEVLHRALTSTRAMSRLGVAFWVPLAMMRVIVRQVPIEGFALRETIGSALVTGISATFASWFVRQTVLRHQPPYRASATRALCAYVLLLGIVGLAQFADERFASNSAGPSALRLGGALLLLYLISAVLDHFDSYRERLTQLVVEQQRLVWVRLSRAARLQRLRAQVVEGLWSEIGDQWRALVVLLDRAREQSMLSAEQLRNCAAAIRGDLIEPIRRRSYQVQEDHAAVEAANASAEISEFVEGEWPWAPEAADVRLDWRGIVAAMPSANPFRPVGVAISMAFLSLINSEYLSVSATALNAVLLTVVVFVLQEGARRWLLPFIRARSELAQWLIFGAAILAMSGALVGIALWVATLDNEPYRWAAFVAAVPMGAVFLGLWSALGAAAVKTSEAQINLQRAIDLRKQETLALEQEEISLRQQIAHTLHGDVQTMLTSAAFRLDLAAEQLQDGVDIAGLPRPSVVASEAAVAISEAADRINQISETRHLERDAMNPGAAAGLAEQVDALGKAWTGIVEVRVSVDPSVAELIDERVNDASLTSIVVDVVREAILNAVRHAHASLITVELVVVDRVCQIIVTNDGRSPTTQVRVGLGGTMLHSLGCNWSLNPGENGGAQLRVELPLLAVRAPIG